MHDETLRINPEPLLVRTRVTEVLRDAILRMRFEPGQRLVERELVELTGVSRTSVREALRELAAEGLVESVPHRGMIVAVLSWAQASQLYELRSSLEGLAGKLFVLRAGDDQVADLVSAFTRIEQSDSLDNELLDLKDAFFEILFDGAANRELKVIVAGFHARVRALRSLSLSEPDRPAQMKCELREILAAIVDRDADRAMSACMRHVDNAASSALEALRRHDDCATPT